MNVSRLVDHPKGKAMVEELRAWLEPLIRWRFNVSDVHYGIADRSVEKIQSEVWRLLYSAWIDREIITTALRRARASVSKGVDIQGSISLKMLLKPPLKTWEGHWENTKTPGGWKCLPAEDDCFADALQADYEMTRLGHIINAWGLEVDGEITEIIECWSAGFWPLDLHGQTDCQTCAGCHTFYRYPVANHWHGYVYPHLGQAVRAEGGSSVEEALEEGLAWGLSFDDINEVDSYHSELVYAAERARKLEITDDTRALSRPARCADTGETGSRASLHEA